MTKKDLQYLGGVIAGGAAGGIGFWLLGEWSGTQMFYGFGRLEQIVALMFIGAVAAAIGVYLLTASDPTSMRTYVFALVCGLVWQPIIDAGKRLATNAAVSSKVEDVNASADQIVREVDNGGNVAAQINNTVPNVKDALQATPSVQDAGKQAAIARSSEKAINAIYRAAPKDPDASLKALSTISLEASRSGQPAVAVQALQGVRNIGFAAAEGRNDALADSATKSLQQISSQTSNETVKTAAENSATSIELKMQELSRPRTADTAAKPSTRPE
jgi:hypothetical protein